MEIIKTCLPFYSRCRHNIKANINEPAFWEKLDQLFFYCNKFRALTLVACFAASTLFGRAISISNEKIEVGVI